MLIITISGVESFDDATQSFVQPNDTVLNLEHSLVSLSKWEAKWEKPFLTGDSKTSEEVYGYVNAMSLTGDIPIDALHRLTEDNLLSINKYIEAKMTATWFLETPQLKSSNQDVVTAEVIYHWMVALQIDWECQNWHLNRLITLVKTINEKNKAASDTKKKAPTSSDLADRRSLMDKRRSEASDRG